MSREKALQTSKNAAMLLVGTMVRMVGNFFFVLYSAKMLGLERFGKLNIANHLFELFLSLAAAAIGIMLTRDIARWQRSLNSLLSSGIVLVSMLCCLVPLVLLPLGFGFGYSPDTMEALGISCLAMFPATLCILLEAVFVAKHRAEFVAIGAAVESLLRVLLGILVLSLGYGIIALMWVLVAVRIGLLIYYWIMLYHFAEYRFRFSYAIFKRFFMRWRVFAAENWMATIYTSLDVLIVSWLAGDVAVGLYSAAWKLVRLGTVFAKSFTTAVFPVMSRLYVDSQTGFQRLFRNSTRALCIVALPIIIAVSILSDRVVALLYKPEFAAAGPILQVMIWILLLEFLNPFLSHVLFAQGKQHRSMYAAAISLSFNLFAAYFLVGRMGAVGAAYAYLGSGFLAMAFYLISIASKEVLVGLVIEFVRIFIAALGMGFVLYYVRDYFVRDQDIPAIILIAFGTYFPLLFAVQGVRIADIHFFKHTFLKKASA